MDATKISNILDTDIANGYATVSLGNAMPLDMEVSSPNTQIDFGSSGQI